MNGIIGFLLGLSLNTKTDTKTYSLKDRIYKCICVSSSPKSAQQISKELEINIMDAQAKLNVLRGEGKIKELIENDENNIPRKKYFI